MSSTAVISSSPVERLTIVVLNALNSEHSRSALQLHCGIFFRWYEDTSGGCTISEAMVQDWSPIYATISSCRRPPSTSA